MSFVFGTSLGMSDIQANMYRHLTGSEPGLVAYWAFNEGSGPATYDATGRGANTGFLSNGVTWVVSDIPLSPDVATMLQQGWRYKRDSQWYCDP